MHVTHCSSWFSPVAITRPPPIRCGRFPAIVYISLVDVLDFVHIFFASFFFYIEHSLFPPVSFGSCLSNMRSMEVGWRGRPGVLINCSARSWYSATVFGTGTQRWAEPVSQKRVSRTTCVLVYRLVRYARSPSCNLFPTVLETPRFY